MFRVFEYQTKGSSFWITYVTDKVEDFVEVKMLRIKLGNIDSLLFVCLVIIMSLNFKKRLFRNLTFLEIDFFLAYSQRKYEVETRVKSLF